MNATLVLAGWLTCLPIAQPTSGPTSQPITADAPTATAPAALPATGPVTGPWLGRAVSLAAPPESQQQSPLVHLADLERAVASASGDGALPARLDLATWLLTRQVEPNLTRMILGVADSTDLAAIDLAAQRAQQQLTAVQQRVDASQQVDSDYRDRLDLLAVWPTVLRAAAIGDAQQCQTIAQALTPLVESSVVPMAQIGRFWTAWLYRRAGMFDEAIGLLDPVLADRRAHPYGVLASALRCDLLADQGYLYAASAMATRVGAKADDGSPAKAAMVLTKLRITDRLADRLDGESLPGLARRQREAARSLRDQTFAPGQSTPVARLGPLLPGLSTLWPIHPTSQPTATRPTTTSAPATQAANPLPSR